jgi:hypothetical protein
MNVSEKQELRQALDEYGFGQDRRANEPPGQVRWRALPIETREAWQALAAAKKIIDIRSYSTEMPVETAAVLWFQLRSLDAREDWFPQGKWPSLQLFEGLITTAAAGLEGVSQ